MVREYHCADCGRPCVDEANRRGRRRILCSDCAVQRLASRCEAAADIRPKKGDTYTFTCRRCGECSTATLDKRRRQFCTSCRGEAGARLTSSIRCAECGERMPSGRTKHCDPCSVVRERLRLQTRPRALAHRANKALSGAARRSSGEAYLRANLGYGVADLRSHLERQFARGMTWAAFKDGRIHIDHIVPLRCFDLTKPDDVKSAFALTNLRPLWAKDNLSKGGKLVVMI